MLLLVLLIFEIELYWNPVKNAKNDLLLFIDNSASMSAIKKFDKNNFLSELKSKIISPLETRNDLRIYLFDNTIKNISRTRIDSIKFDGKGSNLSKVLSFDNKNNSPSEQGAILIVSDGIYNVGSAPDKIAENISLPVYVLGWGDESGKKDISIAEFTTPKIAYTNALVSLKAIIQSEGFEGERVTLRLNSGSELISSKIIKLNSGNLRTEVDFSYTPQYPGIEEIILSIDTLEGEAFVENNEATSFLKVLDKKKDILLIAGAPGYDFTFAKRILNDNPDYKVDYLVEKKNLGSYGTDFNSTLPKLGKYDLVILFGYPNTLSSNIIFKQIYSIINSSNIPIIFFLNNDYRSIDINRMKEILEIEKGSFSGEERDVFIKLAEAYHKNPIIEILNDESANRALWEQAPPLIGAEGEFILKPSSGSILIADNLRSKTIKQNLPFNILSFSKSRQRKTVFIPARGFWRWKLNSSENIGLFENLLTNAIKWTTNKSNSKAVNLYTAKEIFKGSEEFLVRVEVYNENFDPIINAQVKLALKNDEEEIERILNEKESGVYEYNISVERPGQYDLIVDASINGRSLGFDKRSIYIENINHEYQNTKMDKILLKNIAQLSSGQYFEFEEIDKLIEKLPQETYAYQNNYHFILSKSYFILLGIILLFSIELFLRKKWGLL